MVSSSLILINLVLDVLLCLNKTIIFFIFFYNLCNRLLLCYYIMINSINYFVQKNLVKQLCILSDKYILKRYKVGIEVYNNICTKLNYNMNLKKMLTEMMIVKI